MKDGISIVMAYHNRRNQLIKTLKSINNTNYDKNKLQIIIVNDNSDLDNSIDDLNNIFIELDIFVLNIRKKQKDWINSCVPYNIGFNHIKYDKVIIQNPECYHNGDVVSNVDVNLNDMDYISYGCYSLHYKDSLIDDYSTIKLNNSRWYIEENIGRTGWYNHSKYLPTFFHFCSAITHKNLCKLNGFDESYKDGIGFDDNEIIKRIKNLKLNLKIIDKPFVFHQDHDSLYHYNKNTDKNEKELKNKLYLKNKDIYDNVTSTNDKYKAINNTFFNSIKNKRIKILTNKPKEEYELLCHRLIKRYCLINNYDLSFIEDFMHNKHYDYICYIDNTSLILNMDTKIENGINENSSICGYHFNKKNIKNLIIIKNDISLLDDTKIIYDIINDEIGSITEINNIKYINDRLTFRNNDNINNDKFMSHLKDKFIFFNTHNYPSDILKYMYLETYNKVYNDESFENININIDKYKYDSDTEIFNPGQKIAFVSMYTHHIKNEGIQMEYNLKEYCLKNNYTFYIHRKSELEGKKHPCLEKPILIKKHIMDHEYIIWVDSDILIFNQYFKIESEINNKYSLISYNDIDINYPINSGFLIFKNDKISQSIIDNWISDIETKNATTIHGLTHGDQGILNDIIKNHYSKNTLINDNFKVNVPLEKYNPGINNIIHLMGIYGFTRLIPMKYINNIIFNNKLENRFNKVYNDKTWKTGESVSGRGSDTKSTKIIRNELPILFNKYNIKKLIDVSCGDFNWMQKIVDNLDYYKGLDIVDELVNINNEKYSSDKISFERGNVVNDFTHNGEQFNAIICRDTLVHLYFKDVKKVLKNFKESGIRYLIMTHYNKFNPNIDFEKTNEKDLGMWRPINFTLEPFNMINPIYTIEEKEIYTKDGKYCYDKTLSLWDLNSL